MKHARWQLISGGWVVAAVTGCGGGTRAVGPGDFVAAGPGVPAVEAPRPTPAPAVQPASTDRLPVAGGGEAEPSSTQAAEVAVEPLPAVPASGAPAVPTAGGQPRVLDALVGQINGQPVYAEDLLADLDAQLAALGRRLEPAVFRQRAQELIETSLQERLVNALILGEAERGLSEQQRAGVRFMVAERREDLLRRHGRGSLAVARRTLLEDTGLTLDETLRQFRDAVITDNHIRENLNARINVSRRDVERFYRENPETFRPPAKRDLGLLWVDDPATAEAVAGRLRAGEPFPEVAADPAVGNAWAGGDMTTIVGDEPFSRPDVDAAVAGLREPGQWVGPIAQPGPGRAGERSWFVYAAAVEAPPARDLLEAQPEIERTLRERQFVRLRQRFVDRLQAEGSHTPVEEMADAVLRIAINRYGNADAS